jgi:hypothetical protein
MEARTDVGLPAEHFELRVALVGGIAVELCCNVNDVVPLSGNVSRRGDEYGDRPDHWNSEYCNQGRVWFGLDVAGAMFPPRCEQTIASALQPLDRIITNLHPEPVARWSVRPISNRTSLYPPCDELNLTALTKTYRREA